MAILLTFLPFAVRRASAYGVLLVPVLLGTIIATALTSSIVTYTEALRGLGLVHALEESSPSELALRLWADAPRGDRVTRAQVAGRVEGEVARRVGWFTGKPTRYGIKVHFIGRRSWGCN